MSQADVLEQNSRLLPTSGAFVRSLQIPSSNSSARTLPRVRLRVELESGLPRARLALGPACVVHAGRQPLCSAQLCSVVWSAATGIPRARPFTSIHCKLSEWIDLLEKRYAPLGQLSAFLQKLGRNLRPQEQVHQRPSEHPEVGAVAVLGLPDLREVAHRIAAAHVFAHAAGISQALPTVVNW